MTILEINFLLVNENTSSSDLCCGETSLVSSSDVAFLCFIVHCAYIVCVMCIIRLLGTQNFDIKKTNMNMPQTKKKRKKNLE